MQVVKHTVAELGDELFDFGDVLLLGFVGLDLHLVLVTPGLHVRVVVAAVQGERERERGGDAFNRLERIEQKKMVVKAQGELNLDRFRPIAVVWGWHNCMS